MFFVDVPFALVAVLNKISIEWCSKPCLKQYFPDSGIFQKKPRVRKRVWIVVVVVVVVAAVVVVVVVVVVLVLVLVLVVVIIKIIMAVVVVVVVVVAVVVVVVIIKIIRGFSPNVVITLYFLNLKTACA